MSDTLEERVGLWVNSVLTESENIMYQAIATGEFKVNTPDEFLTALAFTAELTVRGFCNMSDDDSMLRVLQASAIIVTTNQWSPSEASPFTQEQLYEGFMTLVANAFTPEEFLSELAKEARLGLPNSGDKVVYANPPNDLPC